MGLRKVAAPFVAVGLATTLPACGEGGVREDTEVRVEMHDNFFVVHGQDVLGLRDHQDDLVEITFNVQNSGDTTHNLEVGNGSLPVDGHEHHDGHQMDAAGELPGVTLEPGEGAAYEVTAEEVVMWGVCHVPGHDEMRFEINIAEAEITTPQHQ